MLPEGKKGKTRVKDKFVFRYDKETKKGIIRTDKGEIRINLEKNKPSSDAVPVAGSSGAGGYGLHLI